MSHRRVEKIAVIGGGASAALLAAQLAQQENADLFHLVIYDRTGRFAKGVAYSTAHDCHLLNVRANNMSAFQNDKDHFVLWAGERGYQPTDFVPRRIYGCYLSECLDTAASNMKIDRIAQDVVACTKQGATFTLTTADGAVEYDRVILASGNVRILRPHVQEGVVGYNDDPWQTDFDTLLQARHVALIGSGLTAVDMVLALDAKGYRGEISIFSRNALLPAPHVAPASWPAFVDNACQSPRKMLRLVREQVKRAALEHVPWQAVIDALRAHTNALWQNWDVAQRQQFGKRLLTLWNVHRHRMAPQIAQRVVALQAEGRLHVIKAGVRSIGVGPVVESAVGAMQFDAVINCLGYRYDEAGRNYAVSDRLGPACFGALFETTAVPEIRAQAHDLAKKIASQVSSNSPAY
jgi:uncharacterized NAD(P)/FAD-binding protein YdhS